jgi:flap endonuclease-1
MQSSGASPIMEIDLSVLLPELELSMDQFIDLCIMCGCDYASNIRGIGAVRALSLIKQHGSIEAALKVSQQQPAAAATAPAICELCLAT